MDVRLEGLEDHIERVVEKKIAAALAAGADDPWYTTEGAAVYLGTTVGQVRNRSTGV